MNKAIGIIEFNSIAKGIEASDVMFKSSENIDIIKSSTICPGKYLIIIFGHVSDVAISLKSGEEVAGKNLVYSHCIRDVSEQLVPALRGLTKPIKGQSIGVVEFFSAATSIFAADVAAKSANITIIDVKIGYAIGGKGVLIFTGDLQDVKTSMDNILNAFSKKSYVINSVVIEKPEDKIYDTLI